MMGQDSAVRGGRNPEHCGLRASPPVSVVVPARNEGATLAETLESVFSQDYAGPLEVIIADGSDGPAMAEMVAQRFPQVRVLSNPQRKTPAGLNLAWRAAAHDIIVRCDARSILPPGYIRQAVRTLARTKAANVGGRQLPKGRTFFERAVALATTTPLGVGDARYRLDGPEGPVDTVYLGVFRRDALEALGGFDERFIRNQDYELNWRIRERGETVWFDANLAVEYRPRGSLRTLARQYFEYGHWKREMLREHPRSLRLRQVAAPLLVGALAASESLALLGAALAALDASSAGAVLAAATAVPLGYALTLLIGAAVVGLRRRSTAALLMPVVLTVIHICWGSGFFAPRSKLMKAVAGSPSEPPPSSATPLKISIITTVHNDVRVGRALDSILGQRHDHEVELIVIDASSDDGTLDVLERYRDRLSVFVSEPDRGPYEGMNKGIRKATGDVIGILNADDRYADANVLRDVAEVLQRNPTVDVCYGDLVYVNSQGDLVRYWQSGANRRFKWRLGWRPPHPTFFVRSSVYQKYGLFDTDYAISADYDLQLRLLFKHRVASKRIARVLVQIAPGGLSTRSLGNIIKANLEATRAWRKNGLWGGWLVPVLKPAIKITQLFRRP